MGPVEDGVGPGEDLEVGGLPGVDLTAQRGEPVEVVDGVQGGGGGAQGVGEAVAPARGGGEGAREGGARGGEGVGMAGHPLERGVGDDEVERLVRLPAQRVGGTEVEAAAAGGGAGE